MRNDVQKAQGGVPRSAKGGGFFSRRAISSYLRIVSSGASTVASTVRSAGASVASSITEREDAAGCDQVHWAGFDKLEVEDDAPRHVLLLGYRSGFQVWDVEEADDVHELASRHDGPVSFLHVQRRPLPTRKSEDRFADVRPLLAIAGDGSSSGGCNNYDGSVSNGDMGSCPDLSNGNFVPTTVKFYSLKTHSYVHVLKFRSAIYTVRSSPRVLAVSQANQIHCFDAATLEREYTIRTSPLISGISGAGGIGYGPLAVGPRWLAYTGSPVVVSNCGRVSPEHLSSASSLSTSPSNGSLVAHYAKESSKQLAAGIMTLGDIGYKKLSKYYSELLPDGSNLRHGNPSLRKNGTNGHLPDGENAGMVIVRDLVSKSVVVQFRAHRSPISALCFDPSGILLVTASVHGNNINVFRVVPPPSGVSLGSDANGSYTHLYRLQRGFTNAIIQDISFSNDSQWIMISSSHGTSHLFAISPSGAATRLPSNDGGFINSNIGFDLSSREAAHWQTGSRMSKLNEQILFTPDSPITLSVVSRIRNGCNGWKGAVSGAAAAATGRVSPLCGAIASSFHNCNDIGVYRDVDSLKTKQHLLVFSPSGCVIQYVLRHLTGADLGTDVSGLSTVFHESTHDSDDSLVVEAIQKWDICHKQKRRDQGDNIDIYGEHRSGDNARHLQKGIKRGTGIHPTDSSAVATTVSAEEKCHLYISEAELHTHASKVPLWAKSEIYFQIMLGDNIKMGIGGLSRGETEVERIPTCTIEARSKGLIPVFDYLQLPRLQQSRGASLDRNQNGPLLHQKYDLSEDGFLPQKGSSGSLDCMSEGSVNVKLSNDTDFDALQASVEDKEALIGFVNNKNDYSKAEAPLEFVNNGGGPKMEAQLECVNNRESLKIMTYFADNDNEID